LVPDEKTQKASGATPMLLQYWKVKAAHFDKVAFFKVGKFYEIFYYDAFIAVHVCELNWMNSDKKPHVGFPEMAKHAYAKKLIAAGYKVVVVEQVERVEEQKQKKVESKQEGGPTGPTCIDRAPCEVFTKGTIVDTEMIGGASAMFMAYLHFEEGEGGAGGDTSFAACLVDCATSQISVGRVADSGDRNALRTFLAQMQPREIVYSSGNIPAEVQSMLKRLPCRPQLSALGAAKLTGLAAKGRLQSYRTAHPGKLVPEVEATLTNGARDSSTIAAAGALEYLEDVLLSGRVLPFAVWQVLDMPSGLSVDASLEEKTADRSVVTAGKRMVLDATALGALEVLESADGAYQGSLLQFLDHTSTPCGFRLLKQWLCAPLYDVAEIRSRQEAVEFFISEPALAKQLRDDLSKVELDLERATSRVWGFALQNERKAVLYEDVTARRLREFADLLQAYEKCADLVATFPARQGLPARLQQITRSKDAGGSFPQLKPVIDRLRNSVVGTPGKNDKIKYRPSDGADQQYDSINKEIAGVKAALEKLLTALQKSHPSMTFEYCLQVVNRYEVEVDEKSAPKNFLTGVQLTSRAGKKVRFQTPEIKKLVTRLDVLDNQLEDCIWPFLSKLFQEFYAHQAQFRAATRLVAEIDALLSLAAASQGLTGNSCIPEIVSLDAPDTTGTLELRNCLHPVAAAKLTTAFVANDTFLNACDVPHILCVTGPNMGGKSTVLRQTCIAVIMAQLGCRVNAAKCRLSPVDRIFTRIGSYDAILEGKSTLLTELEETAAVLAHGTKRSLAVLDELGRGTSTFDGAAIAAAVLDELAKRVGCMSMFATHYHPVSREAVQHKEIAPYHMAASVDDNTQQMVFLYRFLAGLCPSSHGHNVAQLAGLPKAVLEEAISKSAEFERSEKYGAMRDGDGLEIARLAEAGDENALRALFQKIKGGA
jgi:DNA mismatch repair protein MSH6